MPFAELGSNIVREFLCNGINIFPQWIVIVNNLGYLDNSLIYSHKTDQHATHYQYSLHLNNVMKVFITLSHVNVQFSSPEVTMVERVFTHGSHEQATWDLN